MAMCYFLEKANRSFRIPVVIRKKRSLNGWESRSSLEALLTAGKHVHPLSSPQAPKEAAEVEDEKSDFFPTDGENVNYIVHLNDTNFDGFVTEHAQSPILTMFYAPCKWLESASGREDLQRCVAVDIATLSLSLVIRVWTL